MTISRIMMNLWPSTAIALAAALAAGHVDAQPGERWTAASRTAYAVTGDVTLLGGALIFGNGARLRITPVAEREGVWTPLMERRRGAIYRVMPPSDPALLNGNTLCGKPVTFIVLSGSDTRLGLTAFTGPNAPAGFGEESCAVYFYER